MDAVLPLLGMLVVNVAYVGGMIAGFAWGYGPIESIVLGLVWCLGSAAGWVAGLLWYFRKVRG